MHAIETRIEVDWRADGARYRSRDPDADIVELIAGGNMASAIEQLIQRHGAAVDRYCRAALRDHALADDTSQQIFIEAFRDLPRFQGRSTIRVWLFSIARHRVLDAVKKRRAAQHHLEDVPDLASCVSDRRPSQAESLDSARLLAALASSIDELPEGSRTALLLHYRSGLTFTEIGMLCREQPGTLCARVSRALPVLRRRIEARLARLL